MSNAARSRLTPAALGTDSSACDDIPYSVNRRNSTEILHIGACPRYTGRIQIMGVLMVTFVVAAIAACPLLADAQDSSMSTTAKGTTGAGVITVSGAVLVILFLILLVVRLRRRRHGAVAVAPTGSNAPSPSLAAIEFGQFHKLGVGRFREPRSSQENVKLDTQGIAIVPAPEQLV